MIHESEKRYRLADRGANINAVFSSTVKAGLFLTQWLRPQAKLMHMIHKEGISNFCKPGIIKNYLEKRGPEF